MHRELWRAVFRVLLSAHFWMTARADGSLPAQAFTGMTLEDAKKAREM